MAGIKGRSGGHNRKSLQAHLAAGTFRRDRHLALATAAAERAHLPEPAGDRPRAPEGLSVAMAALWTRLVHDFAGWGHADLVLLGVALEQLDRKDECRRRITAEGIITGARPHPLLRVERDAGACVLAIFRHLGLGAPR